MSAIAIIPARGGSRRIPKKNIRPFFGKPIIAYSIRAALESGLFERVVVSTDSFEIGEVAERYGAVAFSRSDGMGRDEIGTQDVMRDALIGYHDYGRWNYACCLYPCSPLLKVYDLQCAMASLLAGQCMTYIYSVGPDRVDCGNFYIGPTRAFIDGMPLEGNSTTFELDASRVCDINVESDWLRAEQMYAELQKGDA